MIDQLYQIIKQSDLLSELLEKSDKLNVPNWYIGAGCVTQTIWNYQHGFPLTKNIKDIDWVYFDSDLSKESEDKIKHIVQDQFKHLSLPLDVTNEARVHLWYEECFGYAIKPYRSVEAAIETWPTTATAIGIRKEKGELKVYAPFGLKDLFDQVIRPNKVQMTEKIFLDKANRWQSCWPETQIIAW